MKLVSALILFLGVQSFAANPMRHHCQNLGGEFWAPQIVGENNDVPLCLLDGAYNDETRDKSAIGGETLLKYIDGTLTMAVLAYKNSVQDCRDEIINTVDEKGFNLSLCKFRDGSVIERNTLMRGPSDPGNEKLNQALGL